MKPNLDRAIEYYNDSSNVGSSVGAPPSFLSDMDLDEEPTKSAAPPRTPIPPFKQQEYNFTEESELPPTSVTGRPVRPLSGFTKLKNTSFRSTNKTANIIITGLKNFNFPFVGEGYFTGTSIIWESCVYFLIWTVSNLLYLEISIKYHKYLDVITNSILIACLVGVYAVFTSRAQHKQNKKLQKIVNRMNIYVKLDPGAIDVDISPEEFNRHVIELDKIRKTCVASNRKYMSMLSIMVTYFIVATLLN